MIVRLMSRSDVGLVSKVENRSSKALELLILWSSGVKSLTKMKVEIDSKRMRKNTPDR